MIKLADYGTEKALPSEMRTAERNALAYAFDMQKKKFLERTKSVYIWADLEKVDDNKLDFLAVENRVLFYDTSLAPDVKRNLIRNYLYWYIKLGTRQAMDEMASILYGGDEHRIEEWYEYDGEPYHFRVFTTLPLMEDCYADYKAFIKEVKNARSRLDQIYTIRRAYGIFHAATATIHKVRNPVICEGYNTARMSVLNASAAVAQINTIRDPPLYEGYETKRSTEIAVGSAGNLVSVSLSPPQLEGFEINRQANVQSHASGIISGTQRQIIT